VIYKNFSQFMIALNSYRRCRYENFKTDIYSCE